MMLTITIDNASVVANAVNLAFNNKKAEIVSSLVASGMDPVAADANAESQLADLRIMTDYVYYSKTKCVLTFNSEDHSISVIGDNTLEDNLPFV